MNPTLVAVHLLWMICSLSVTAGDSIIITPVDPFKNVYSPMDLAKQWVSIKTGKLAEVEIERVLYEKTGEQGMHFCFRIKNSSDAPIGIDLRNAAEVIYPNQLEQSETDHRWIINEGHVVHKSLNEDECKSLMDDFAAKKLMTVEPGKELRYYLRWGGSWMRPDLDKPHNGCKFLIVSIYGQLRVTNSKRVEEISFGDFGPEFAISLPVKWEQIPDDGIVLKK